MKTEMKIKKQDMVTAESSKGKIEGFIRKFEKQVNFFYFFESVHFELSKKISDEYCSFCHSGRTLRIDLVKKTFSCSVCGLKGGLVLYVMLRHKCSLRAALKYIVENCVNVDITVIPHHTLIS